MMVGPFKFDSHQNPKAWALLGALACLMAAWQPAVAQLQVLSNQSPQSIFAGDAREVSVLFRNPDSQSVESEISWRLHQATSATAMKAGEARWKKIPVLPGQTIAESAKVDFPAVKAETRFVIQWIAGTNDVLGRTEILAYPTNLLKELKSLAGDEPLGVFDPQNQLKPLLKNVSVEFSDLEEAGFEQFSGKLAIIGPFAAKAEMPEGVTKRIEKLAGKGVAVVWIQPPPGPREKLRPSFYAVTNDPGAVVVVQAELMTRISERPQAQLNLIHCARLALHPEPMRLPLTSPQP